MKAMPGSPMLVPSWGGGWPLPVARLHPEGGFGSFVSRCLDLPADFPSGGAGTLCEVKATAFATGFPVAAGNQDSERAFLCPVGSI